MEDKGKNSGIAGRVFIEGVIHCATGLHIGGGKDNMAIGVVDLTVVRDPLTRQPIIPGSSLKGKMRTLLARMYFNPETNPDGFQGLKIEKDPREIKRLFGATDPIIQSRLQFCDAQLTKQSIDRLNKADTDLYLSEVKYENTINRITSQAMPRQIERVPAGAEFLFKLTYLIETGLNEDEWKADLDMMKDGLILLQHDYLGGHGSRGSGRIVFKDLKSEVRAYQQQLLQTEKVQYYFEQCIPEIQEAGFFQETHMVGAANG